MGKDRTPMDQLADDLKELRDEIKLKIHLAAADARDEWEGLEKKWEGLRTRLEAAGDVAAETAGEVGEALKLAADELKKGYERIRKAL